MVPPPPALGDALPLDCEPVADELDAPLPWASVGEPWLAFADWFDASPYGNGNRTYRGVHDLAVHADRLLVGIGDVDSNPGSLYCPDSGGPCDHADASGHGLPILALDRDGGLESALVVREEIVSRFRRSGSALLVPGIDPTEGDGPPACMQPEAPRPCENEPEWEHPRFELGHLYVELDGWRVSEPIPEVWHIHDVAWMDGVLFAVGSGVLRPDDNGGDGTIWRSEDEGRTWTVERALRDHPQGHQRFWLTAPAGDRLYVFGSNLWNASERRNISQVWDGGSWSPAPDLLDGFGEGVDGESFDAERVFVWGVRELDGQKRRRAAVVEGDGSHPVAFFEQQGWEPYAASVPCEGDLLVLSRSWPAERDTWAIHRTSDLETWDELVRWQADAIYSAMAVWEGAVILGDTAGGLHRSPVGSGGR